MASGRSRHNARTFFSAALAPGREGGGIQPLGVARVFVFRFVPERGFRFEPVTTARVYRNHKLAAISRRYGSPASVHRRPGIVRLCGGVQLAPFELTHRDRSRQRTDPGQKSARGQIA